MLIISILVFCIVLFLYLHVYFHLKHSNDLEVYEIEQPSKQRLEEVCDIRQPTTFYYSNDQLLYLASYNSVYSNYRAFDIQLRDASNSVAYLNDSQITTDVNELYIPIALKVANQAFRSDKDAKFLSNYFMVTQGRVKILLIPPKYTKYLFPIDDYENFEFISPVNPWNVQQNYQNEFDKLKTLDVELTSGMMMYIPAYWWYSIKFMEDDTSVCSFKYRTYMSNISILPRLCMKVLQNHNVKRDTIKKRTFIPVPGETVFTTDNSFNNLTKPNIQQIQMRSSINPFSLNIIDENKERIHTDEPILNVALSSIIASSNNDTANNNLIMQTDNSKNNEIILTNDNITISEQKN